MPNQSNKRARILRQRIAEEAARIMATEALSNYRSAKQKGAERLGISSHAALPSNLEVEQALKSYHQLYGGQEHQDTLNHFRRSAIKAMQALQTFSPRLAGPVLEGTANKHSRITLHVFSDPTDAVALHLMNQGINYKEEERRIRWHDGSYRELSLLVVEADGINTELLLFTLLDQRQAPPSPVNGKPQRRATIAEIQHLLEWEKPQMITS